MEGVDKTYSIYKIISPSGMQYVGYTSQAISERWRHHKIRAFNGEAKGHPFYDEIRKYNGEGFSVIKMTQSHSRINAMQFEEKFIAEIPEGKAMNIIYRPGVSMMAKKAQRPHGRESMHRQRLGRHI